MVARLLAVALLAVTLLGLPGALGLLAETGIPAALLFIAMIALGLWNFLRARALCAQKTAKQGWAQGWGP